MRIYIPLGSICSVAFNLQNLKLRDFALPFDWVKIEKLDYISDVLENNFKDFLNVRQISESQKFPIFYDNYNDITPNSNNTSQLSKIMINQYKIKFYHDFCEHSNQQSNKEIKEKYNRRIERLYDLLNGKYEIYFIRDEIKYKNIDNQEINRFINVLLKINSNLNYKIIIILHNPKNKQLQFSEINNVKIINDTNPFGSWKRENFDWNSLLNNT